MVFICWGRPSPQEKKDCILKSGLFNYDSKYRGLSSKPLSMVKEEKDLEKDGFSINYARTLVGSGMETFEKVEPKFSSGERDSYMKGHFGLDWAYVDPKFPTAVGTKFCVCVKEVFPWIMMPLQVVYENETRSNTNRGASFGFGSGTLQGHLLAGEERFSVEMDENNQVWYEILSFSKPAHFLSAIGYPYVHVMQKYFAHQSTKAVKKHLSA